MVTSFGSPRQNPVCVTPLPQTCYTHCPSYSYVFGNSNNILWTVYCIKVPFSYSSPHPCNLVRQGSLPHTNLSRGIFLLVLSCLLCNCCRLTVCIVVVVLCVLLCVFVVLCGHCCFFFTLDAGLLARSQYSEGPATGHLVTGFSWFPFA